MTVQKYYENIRTDIAPMLPDKVEKVLEVGCGTGNTLFWLKNYKKSLWVGGVEIFPEAATEARTKLDAVYLGNIEHINLPIEDSTLDLVLCLDVLEHLVDPWNVLRRLQRLLKPYGSLIASIPNIRNKSILFPLLFKGQWEYTKTGILDRTHIRFFTRDTAVKLFEYAELDVDMVMSTGLERKTRKSQIFISLLPEWIKSFLVTQYLIRGIRQE